MRFIARLATTMLVFLILSSLFYDALRVDNWLVALGSALVLSILNTIIKPILIILTLPLTFGLFTIIVDAIMLEITAGFIQGFEFSSFGWAIFTAIILSIVNALLTPNIRIYTERK